MKIVYTKDISKQAKKGDIKDVADGFARFLLASGSAVLATSSVINTITQQKNHKDSLKQKSAAEFKIIADTLKNKVFVIEVKAAKGKQFFGGVHEEEIKVAIKKSTGIVLNPKSIKIPKPIKETGMYMIAISEGTMHTQVEVEVKSV